MLEGGLQKQGGRLPNYAALWETLQYLNQFYQEMNLHWNWASCEDCEAPNLQHHT